MSLIRKTTNQSRGQYQFEDLLNYVRVVYPGGSPVVG